MQGCRPLSDEEIKQLLRIVSLKARVLILTELFFGTRISETLNLTFGDVTGEYVPIKSMKNSDNQTFPIPEQYKEAVSHLKLKYQRQGIKVADDTPLFLSQKDHGKTISRQNASDLIKRAVKKLGFEGKINNHSFRKSFISKIYQKTNFDIATTRIYSRHKNLGNLQHYLATSETPDLVNGLEW